LRDEFRCGGRIGSGRHLLRMLTDGIKAVTLIKEKA